MLFYVLLGAPFLLSAVLAALFGETEERLMTLLGLGLALAVGLVVFVHFASPEGRPQSCHDCGEYLGRWWQPDLAFALAFVGLVAWCGGVWAGERASDVSKSLELLEGLAAGVAVADRAARRRAEEVVEPRVGRAAVGARMRARVDLEQSRGRRA